MGVVQAIGLGVDALPRIGKGTGDTRTCAIGEIPALGQRPRAGVEGGQERTLEVGKEGLVDACHHVHRRLQRFLAPFPWPRLPRSVVYNLSQ